MSSFRKFVSEKYRELSEEREKELKNTPWYKWDKRRHLKKAAEYYKKMSERYK